MSNYLSVSLERVAHHLLLLCCEDWLMAMHLPESGCRCRYEIGVTSSNRFIDLLSRA